MSRSGELRILLIEDSALLRKRLVGLLDVPGTMSVVAEAETESDAKAYIDADSYDILVVDVELKQGSGIAVVRHARHRYEESNASAPLIVVLTNYALPTVEQRCMAAGADHFLDKMRQFGEVRPLIERWRGANAN